MLHVACTVPTTLFSPAASPARAIFGLSLLTLSIVATIFLTVGGLLLYALVKYRERPNQEEREPVQLYGSNQIELSWTVIPILIVVVLFLATWDTSSGGSFAIPERMWSRPTNCTFPRAARPMSGQPF
jgi:heme/copper-type cytochrome/quinol oxidase subunit 2